MIGMDRRVGTSMQALICWDSQCGSIALRAHRYNCSILPES
jgi:hypothetical protein